MTPVPRREGSVVNNPVDWRQRTKDVGPVGYVPRDPCRAWTNGPELDADAPDLLIAFA